MAATMAPDPWTLAPAPSGARVLALVCRLRAVPWSLCRRRARSRPLRRQTGVVLIRPLPFDEFRRRARAEGYRQLSALRCALEVRPSPPDGSNVSLAVRPGPVGYQDRACSVIAVSGSSASQLLAGAVAHAARVCALLGFTIAYAYPPPSSPVAAWTSAGWTDAGTTPRGRPRLRFLVAPLMRLWSPRPGVELTIRAYARDGSERLVEQPDVAIVSASFVAGRSRGRHWYPDGRRLEWASASALDLSE